LLKKGANYMGKRNILRFPGDNKLKTQPTQGQPVKAAIETAALSLKKTN
jgi:hypothetical protein